MPAGAVLKSISALIRLTIHAPSPAVYNLARDISIRSTATVVGHNTTDPSTNNTETARCISHELTLWLDGTTDATLPTLYRLLSWKRLLLFVH